MSHNTDGVHRSAQIKMMQDYITQCKVDNRFETVWQYTEKDIPHRPVEMAAFCDCWMET